MIFTPKYAVSVELTGAGSGDLSFEVSTTELELLLIPALKGAQGESWQETFESVSQGLGAYNYTINRTDGAVSSIVYDLGNGQSITKTLGRVDGVLTTITLSGDTPSGVDLVKTLVRDITGKVTGATYA